MYKPLPHYWNRELLPHSILSDEPACLSDSAILLWRWNVLKWSLLKVKLLVSWMCCNIFTFYRPRWIWSVKEMSMLLFRKWEGIMVSSVVYSITINALFCFCCVFQFLQIIPRYKVSRTWLSKLLNTMTTIRYSSSTNPVHYVVPSHHASQVPPSIWAILHFQPTQQLFWGQDLQPQVQVHIVPVNFNHCYWTG